MKVIAVKDNGSFMEYVVTSYDAEHEEAALESWLRCLTPSSVLMRGSASVFERYPLPSASLSTFCRWSVPVSIRRSEKSRIGLTASPSRERWRSRRVLSRSKSTAVTSMPDSDGVCLLCHARGQIGWSLPEEVVEQHRGMGYPLDSPSRWVRYRR